jgi:hypothetical protein
LSCRRGIPPWQSLSLTSVFEYQDIFHARKDSVPLTRKDSVPLTRKDSVPLTRKDSVPLTRSGLVRKGSPSYPRHPKISPSIRSKRTDPLTFSPA